MSPPHHTTPRHPSCHLFRPFLGPTDQTLWPFPDSLTWHQQTLFRQR
ncbi:MAG: hypothetical protein KC434_20785 [Anaerolineales bacterium]|nr:hypothetical protein [Anaerolineales bacterium]